MRKIALALALAAVSGAGMAEWMNFDGNNEVTFYVDPATIRRSGDMVKFWRLASFNSPQTIGRGVSYLSVKSQEEYDCKEDRNRTLNLAAYSQKMGIGGPILSVDEPLEWKPVAPATIVEVLWKYACRKE